MANTFQLEHSDASAAFYHIHLLTHQEDCFFGEAVNEATKLNSSGQIAVDEWHQVAAAHQRDIKLDLWTILPNGIRALVVLAGDDIYPSTYSFRTQQLKPRALSLFVAGFKAAAAKRINLVRGVPGAPVWKKGYQEQRIDDPKTLDRIRQLLTHEAHAAGLIADLER